MIKVTITDNDDNTINNSLFIEEDSDVITVTESINVGITDTSKLISNKTNNIIQLDEEGKLFASSNTFLKQDDW